MFRPRLRIPRVGLARPALRRSMHHIPPLPHDFREGVPGLLSPDGFDMAWTQYMTVMLEKLNALTAGMPKRSHPPFLHLGSMAAVADPKNEGNLWSNRRHETLLPGANARGRG